MDMSMSGMGHMSMGDGVPGSAIAAGTVINILNRFLAYQRLKDSSLTPSKPKSIFFSTYATLTAIVREASYATLPPLSFRGHFYHFAPLGPVAIILANLIVVLVFCFYKLDTADQWKWEDVGYRTGFIAICQLPLIFLLAGRQNLIGMLVGMSYERLNWFHRWIARTLWLTATIHMCFWFRDWGRYNYIVYELKNYTLATRGFAAWIILTFIVITSAAPIRRLGYEFFVLQHLVTFVGFIVAVWLHAPAEVKVWVWIPIGFLVFDRVARYLWATYANLSIFHRSKSPAHALWANRATFTPLPGNVTRIAIENPGVGWKPGQHVFLTCHSIVPLQSHPFTIASIPEDNKMVMYVRAEKGGTRRFFRYASKNHQVLGASDQVAVKQARTVFIEGPYGQMRPLKQFDSVILLAGGMGATFTVPCLRDIVAKWKAESTARLAATKRVRFVWVIKSRTQLSWFDRQLQEVLRDVEEVRLANPDVIREIEMSIYITCDEKLEQAQNTLCAQEQSLFQLQSSLPANEKSLEAEKAATDAVAIESVEQSGCQPDGKCCCTVPIKDEDAIDATTCTCSGHAAPQSTSELATGSDSKPTQKPLPNLTVLSGRPHARTIIRKVLEKAEGESAVVVCGPRGLSDDVRRSVSTSTIESD
ncbi:metalloreductase [Aspergillus eucalypticola CBS 122712]|uniref:ferric-chelate reductase (NADPH) n=1 Tax=Aspergillus eucalypticola (strain CBS 122712 / IBT 29274) TaxID=1448314 RepID=A0A317VNC2_ASPEC|nr:metalloreductase [Aspergillus eucalypticola CBS 122712]PWY75826.1 metalloreductase [Aspergillus eucalypticola CBS 122712]